MGPISRQDVQNIVDNSRTQLFQRVALKQDIQVLSETVKNMLVLLQQNQQFLRQAEYQRSQTTRRMVALEARLTALEQEIKPLRTVVTKMVEQQQRTAQVPQIVVQPAPTPRQGSVAPEQQYLYRPQ